MGDSLSSLLKPHSPREPQPESDVNPHSIPLPWHEVDQTCLQPTQEKRADVHGGEGAGG